MDVVYTCCAGLDVHRDTVVACALWADGEGRRHKDTQTFGTMTRDLLALSDWLAARNVTCAAMESTGVFWKPIWHILEDRFKLMLVNARHIKQVPGRKTDVKDAEWIGQLLQHGLLRPSFVPDRAHRQLRDLTRHRAQLVGDQTRVANRIHKTLEDTNIKLGSVASDILGASGRLMIQGLIQGQAQAESLAQLAKGQLRSKHDQLVAALEGKLTEHHRFMLKILWEQLRQLEQMIAQIDVRIEEQMRPFESQLAQLDAVTGVNVLTARAVIAETGLDMSRFPSDGHISSWAGVCCGNNESAGKRKSGKTTQGNRWLRRALSQAAWAAARSKNTYLSSLYHRLAARRGKKRAIVAVAHTILVIIYHILRTGKPYNELGGNYLDQIRSDQVKRALVRRLQRLGYEVTVKPVPTAA